MERVRGRNDGSKRAEVGWEGKGSGERNPEVAERFTPSEERTQNSIES